MDNIQNYKCPCCDAPLTFMGDKLICESCDSQFDLSVLEQVTEAQSKGVNESAYNWQEHQPREYAQEEQMNLSSYSCPSCGAEISGDSTMGATICPYCGNATIVPKQFEGTLKPDFVIPFKVDKAAAMKAFQNACAKAPFLPNEFKDKKRIEEMSGVYVPFWLFDCDCSASIEYSAKNITHWSDSKYNYTRTEHYKLVRSGSVGFADIPVDGSKKADDTYMEALEPFDYSEGVEFNTAYLSGHFADKYDVSADESADRANERVKNSTEQVFARTVDSRYTAVVPTQSHINFSEGKIKYTLLPVWMLNIKYDGKIYKYAVNGQTGKTVGDFPVSKKKRNAYFAKVGSIAAAVGFALATLYSFFI